MGGGEAVAAAGRVLEGYTLVQRCSCILLRAAAFKESYSYILTLAVRTSMMQLYAVDTLFHFPGGLFSCVASTTAELAPQTHNPDNMIWYRLP